jgi:hypothetical protein
MKYEPWTYEPTRELHDLFQEKFGKVWNCKVQHDSVKHVYLTLNQTLDITFSQLSLDEPSEDILPALTLSSFCEFVDENLNFMGNPPHGDWYINDQLKYFAVDNWDEPEKIIEEVKKYL